MVDVALEWALTARKDFPDSDSIWDVAFNWPTQKQIILNQLKQNNYSFEVVKIIRKASGITYLWHARDAIVLKALTIALTHTIKLNPRCTHIKGHGGMHKAVKSIGGSVKNYNFVFKSDVKDFYQSINHDILISLLKSKGCFAPCLIKFIESFLSHSEEYGGLFYQMTIGISKSCPLSSWLGALYLEMLDKAICKLNIFYIRFMDDIFILTKIQAALPISGSVRFTS